MSKPKLIISRGKVNRSFDDIINMIHSGLMNDIQILKHINKLLPQAVENFSLAARENFSKQVNNLDEEGEKQLGLLRNRTSDHQTTT